MASKTGYNRDNDTSLDMYNINNDKIETEDISRLEENTLLYPVAKAFLEVFPQYYDIFRTYEDAMDSIKDIVGTDSIINQFVPTADGKHFIHFKMYIDNVRIYPPDSAEAAQYSAYGYVPTPNIACAKKGMYAAIVVGDTIYKYKIYNKQTNLDITHLDFEITEDDMVVRTIPNSYCVNMPIPIGCKYCALNHYDINTLIKTGEDMRSFYGFFVIDGFLRYILPLYKKPFNKPIITKNDRDPDQLSRTEVIYTKGYEYEHSYYMIGAMVEKKQSSVGRGGACASPPDFGFSLQFNHQYMGVDTGVYSSKHSKTLINFIPIKFLFAAFGCTSDLRLLQYICPQMDDFGLINAIRQACLQGFKHREAIETAGIKLKNSSDYIIYDEPITEATAKYIIGCIIISDKYKTETFDKCKGNTLAYKLALVGMVNTIFDECFMPGIGDNSNVDRNTAICVEMGSIIRELYLIGYGLEPTQDKTSLTNRRIRHGQQISREFKAFHNVRLREIMLQLVPIFKERIDMRGLSEILEPKMRVIMKNVSLNQSKSILNAFKGASKEQSKLRTDLIAPKNKAFVDNRLREIVISSDLKQEGATVSWEHRTVHQSELFFICPTQTPEAGVQTGRFKTPTLFTYITLSTKGKEISKIIQNWDGYVKILGDKNEHLYTIRMNGSIIGYVPMYENVENLYQRLMDARRKGEIEVDATIVLNHHNSSLAIWTDTGRIVSPFVIVKNAFNIKLKENSDFTLNGSVEIKDDFKKWLEKCALDYGAYDEGIRNGYIEYYDPEMAIYNAVIAPSLKEFYMNPLRYTHIALPAHIHGIIAGIVPTTNLNTGVRSAYVTNHVKQAIGPSLRYPQLKFIGESNVLIAPQIPLARPCVYDYLHMNDFPIGQNVIVAFMQYKDNQEDAVIMNRASVEQGLLQIDSLITKLVEDPSKDEEYRVPGSNITLNGNPNAYSKLDPQTSLPRKVGDVFYQHDPLIGVVRTDKGEIDVSVLNEKPDGKYPPSANLRPLRCVEKHMLHGRSKTLKMALFGQYRVPIVGDKFNPENAQKGTVGKIMDVEMLPYTSTGIRPDIIFNPPGTFKRKTYGQVYYAMLAKIAALMGCPVDCTPYHTIRNDDEIIAFMEKLGLNDSGYETMYDPETGEPIKSRVFVGMHYWERQPHLVEQKLNIRNGGPRDKETGQPTKGLKKHGGQSSDRMSFDSHIASGICEIMRDMHLNQGSKIAVGICKKCHGMMGYLHKNNQEWVCPQCGPHRDIIVREIPPASEMLIHILNGLHVAVDYYSNM